MLRKTVFFRVRILIATIMLISLSLSCMFSVFALTSDKVVVNEVNLTYDFIRNAQASIDNNVILFSKTTSQGNNSYLCETIYVVPTANTSAITLLNDLTKQATSNARNAITVEEFDPSISIKGWVTTTYVSISSSLGPASKVTGVSGGYTKSDRSVSVSSQTVCYGSTGFRASTGNFIEQNVDEYPTSTSWEYTAPANWEYIVEAGVHNIGANCTFDLVRYGSTWSFTVESIVSQG